MKKLIVYRLENEKGIGPYRGGHREDAESLLGHTNPLFWDDKLSSRRKKILYTKGWAYAWSCSETFDLWMNGKEEFMKGLGYNKVTYTTTQYRCYTEQEFWKYIAEEEDWLKFSVEGAQVIFNPEWSVKT